MPWEAPSRASSPLPSPTAREGAGLGQGQRLRTEGRSASHAPCIPSKPVVKQRCWAELRVGRELGLGRFLCGGKAVSLPTEPCWSQSSQFSCPGPMANSHRAEWTRSHLYSTVPGEGDAACAKDLPEEVAACSTWQEEEFIWSGMAFSSPAELTPPSSLASHLAEGTHRLHRLHCATQEGCAPGTRQIQSHNPTGTEPSSPVTEAAHRYTLRVPLLPGRDRCSCVQLPQGRQL